MNQKKNIKTTDDYKKENMLSYYLLLTTIIICMISSGGLFWYQCIIPCLCLFVLIIINRKKIAFDYSALLILLVLICSLLPLAGTLADKQYCIHEYEKILCFVLAYYVGAAIDEKQVLKAIGFSGLILAVAGLLSYCNLIRLDEFVFNDRKLLRLQSFVKYANTSAAILAGCYFALLKLYKESEKKYLLYISGCVLTALLLTVSKAAVLIFLCIAAAVTVADIKTAKTIIFQVIICMITAVPSLFLAKNHYYGICILVIITGIIFSAAADKKLFVINIKNSVLAAIYILGIIAALAACLFLKRDIFITLFKRFDYMSDAMKLMKRHWISGIGPGGWKYYQYSVQSVKQSGIIIIEESLLPLH